MTIFLVFVAVLAAGAVALLATRHPPSRLPAVTRADGLAEPDPRMPPVLLPEQVQPSDIERLRFSVALRGYRMDQVDAVLVRLASALAERDAALAAVRGRPGGARPEEPGALS
ncbi:DivIVA domain-containing protein [Arthrobacter sp. zg-Y1219]|uniref:DivIVA domain-containing protein n=1 Tax=Arthrobacter sp. zg-Y1219 TaxID=3049067 RepID=UPI0024C226E1|nr:DivIVA domain-containing protein [Arthrobacter sp. zg-Y1219]MDK1359615.1 DivIVA domain-containing protein [Arthrobacter sp. zg-Y1219]